MYDGHFVLQDTWNLLMWALHDGRLECLKLVLDSGTHVNLQDNVSAVSKSLYYMFAPKKRAQ